MAAACVVLVLARRVPLGVAVDAYLVTNLGMVAAFGAIGGLVAGNRPGNPIGWLFLGHSLCFGVATLAGTVAVARQDVLSAGTLRPLPIVFMGVWPLGIGIALPLGRAAVPDRPAARPAMAPATGGRRYRGLEATVTARLESPSSSRRVKRRRAAT